MTDLAERALQIIIGQLGQQEHPKGSNWGRPVQDYLAAVKINFPASWCMALVYYCYEQAAMQLGITNPLYQTGGVLSQWNNSKQHHVGNPQSGDIFIMDFGHGLGHTGIIETIDKSALKLSLHTIDGNTNDTGSREGFEVCRKIRDPQKMKGYLRV